MGLADVIFISDLDGTMLLPDRTLGERTKRAVRALLEAGGLFTVATGRCAASSAHLLQDLPLRLSAIVHNGAQTVDLRSGITSELVTMPGPVVARLVEASAAAGLSVQAYVWTPEQTVELIHGPAINPPTARYTEVMGQVVPAMPHDGSPAAVRRLERCQGLSFLYLDSADALAAFFAEQCAPATGVVTSLGKSAYTQGIAVGEVQWGEATKANAARRLVQAQGVEPARIVAFGDNANDLPLLRLAGRALCPPDAAPAVLAEVKGRVPPCADEGVAAFLERVLDGEDPLSAIDPLTWR